MKRILFVGNIANNAFLIGELLNNHGLMVDVMCDDYFHCMAYPEWENLAFSVDEQSQIRVDKNIILNQEEYERPKWFAQGNRDTVLNYLLELNKFNRSQSLVLWEKLLDESFKNYNKRNSQDTKNEIPKGNSLPDNSSQNSMLVNRRIERIIRNYLRNLTIRYLIYFKSQAVGNLIKIIQLFFKSRYLSRKIVSIIPNKILTKMLVQFYGKDTCAKFRKLSNYYDDIVLFGPSAIWSYLVPEKNYIYFEHGTIRYARESHDLYAKILKRIYKSAKAIFVTNGDVYSYLELVPQATLIPTTHPILVEEKLNLVDAEKVLSQEIKCWAELKESSYLFCPVRQDWEVKGVNFYLENLDEIFANFPKIRVVFTKWGSDLNRAMQTLNDKKYKNQITWINTYSRPSLALLMKYSHLVLDQMALPHFGSTAPQALALGVPVVSKYDPESTRIICANPAPIYPVFSSKDLLHAINFYSNEHNRLEHAKKARKWVDDFHSDDRIINDFESLF